MDSRSSLGVCLLAWIIAAIYATGTAFSAWTCQLLGDLFQEMPIEPDTVFSQHTTIEAARGYARLNLILASLFMIALLLMTCIILSRLFITNRAESSSLVLGASPLLLCLGLEGLFEILMSISTWGWHKTLLSHGSEQLILQWKIMLAFNLALPCLMATMVLGLVIFIACLSR